MGFTGAYVYTSELLPTEARNAGFGAVNLCSGLTGIVAPFVGGPLVSSQIFYSDDFSEFREFMGNIFCSYYIFSIPNYLRASSLLGYNIFFKIHTRLSVSAGWRETKLMKKNRVDEKQAMKMI